MAYMMARKPSQVWEGSGWRLLEAKINYWSDELVIIEEGCDEHDGEYTVASIPLEGVVPDMTEEGIGEFIMDNNDKGIGVTGTLEQVLGIYNYNSFE